MRTRLREGKEGVAVYVGGGARQSHGGGREITSPARGSICSGAGLSERLRCGNSRMPVGEGNFAGNEVDKPEGKNNH